MNRKSYLLPAAAGSVLLTMFSLGQVFAEQRWFWPSVLAVLVAFGIGWVGRRLDVPGVLSPALSLLALVTLLGIEFHAGTTAAGLPSAATMHAIGESLSQSLRDVRELAAPATPTPALTLLATSGVFVVASLIDVMVFRLRRPVAAGIPLLALYLVPTSMTTHANVFAFVLGAVGYLAVLVAEGRDRARSWGRRLSGVERADDVADVSQVARIGRRLGTAAVGIALFSPLLVPSVGKGIFTGAGSGPFGRGRGSHTAVVVNPIVTIRAQVQDKVERPLFEVRTNRPEYLRMTSLDEFNGVEWSFVKTDNIPSSHKVGKGKHIPAPAQFDEVPTTEATYDIDVGDLAVAWLPIPYAPSSVDIKGDWRWESVGLSVFSSTKTTHGVQYVAVSTVPQPTIDQLERKGTIPASMQKYLVTPPNTPQVAIDALATATKGATTPYQKARALNEYFFNPAVGGFVYDLDVPPGSSEDALANFLRDKHGYCEQFAATMAYLGRLAGIPARVAVGFTPGKMTGDGVYVVSNHDAHAWPELWFPHAGWVRFEPTPRSGTAVPGYAAPVSSTPGTPGPSASGSSGPSASGSPTPTAGPKGADEANAPNEDTTNPAPAKRAAHSSVPVVPIGLGVLVVVLVTPSLVGVGVRRRRRSRAVDHVARINAAWESLADAAEDAGYPLRASDSPRAAARRLIAAASLYGDPAAEIERLARAEERARYARSAPPADGLDAGVRLVRRSLRASLPRVGQVRALVFPASSVRRIVEGVRQASDWSERVRDGSRARVRAMARAVVRRVRPA